MLTDPYYKIKSDIHQKRPAYGYCMTVWMLIMTTLSCIFGYYYYNIEVRNECLVRNDKSVPENSSLGASDDPTIQSVSNDFDFVLSMFFL